LRSTSRRSRLRADRAVRSPSQTPATGRAWRSPGHELDRAVRSARPPRRVPDPSRRPGFDRRPSERMRSPRADPSKDQHKARGRVAAAVAVREDCEQGPRSDRHQRPCDPPDDPRSTAVLRAAVDRRPGAEADRQQRDVDPAIAVTTFERDGSVPASDHRGVIPVRRPAGAAHRDRVGSLARPRGGASYARFGPFRLGTRVLLSPHRTHPRHRIASLAVRGLRGTSRLDASRDVRADPRVALPAQSGSERRDDPSLAFE
jgi:hypothetical protein